MRHPARARIAAFCLLIAFAGLGGGGAAGPASAATCKPKASKKCKKLAAAEKVKRQATALLRGGRFTRFVGSNTGSTTFDERLHLCSTGRFVYDTVSSSGEGDPDVRRVEGRWSVTSATHKGNVWTARVRGVPANGPALTVNFRKEGNRVTIDGNLVIAERSDLCS